MALEEILPELPWLLTLVCVAGIVIMIAMCVCAKHTEKVQEYGTAGRLSITRDSPIFHHPTSNGNIFTVKPLDQDSLLEEGTLKRNSWTVKDRALPDIPLGSSIPNANAFSSAATEENHVIIEDTNFKKKSHNKPAAPKPPVDDASSKELNSLTKEAPHVMKIIVNDKPLASELEKVAAAPPSRFNTRPRTQIIESIPGTSNSSVVLKKVEKSVSTSSPIRRVSDSDARNYDDANHYAEPQIETLSVASSPVCIRIGTTSNPVEGISVTTPAGLAVAGAVPSSDIPYMTPPVHHTVALQNSEERPQESMNSPIHRSEVPYTVISVREPLAKVREMTFRKQRMVQQKSDDGENQYSMVPEEEQMYAEIGSGQDSGSSSITYAHIEPRELPPVPPTVESLKSVAHAHSRQASTVSTSSFGSCLSGSAENTSPPSLRNPSAALYSAVEKHPKQRKTIHIAEGASVISSMEKHKNVEDLYAKVRKKRVDLTVGISCPEKYPNYQEVGGENSECLTPPPSPWASTTPPAPPPITGRLQAASLGVISSAGFQHVRRHSADPKLHERIRETNGTENKHFSYTIVNKTEAEPGYEQIYNEDENADDSCYEKIKDDDVAEPKSQADYASVGPQDVDQNSFNCTCYESVKDVDKDSSDPGYECVTQLGGEGSSSDPGYEPVRISSVLEDSDSNHGYTTVDLGEESEPNYETVKKISRTESDAVDPGYEKVKKVHRSDSDATDPGYEKVKNKAIEESTDPGYATVQRSDSDTEPGYETVRHQKETNAKISKIPRNHSSSHVRQSSLNSKSNNSTILFVSGNSSHSMKQLEPKSKESSDDSSFECEGTATFL